MDAAVLRAELKAWERDFRSKHSRNPTVEEIKDQPAIAAKYKLYKSVSKSATSSFVAKPPPARSSTPPRSQSRQSTRLSTSLLPKARAVKVDPPIQTTNPFSPVKKKPRKSAVTRARKRLRGEPVSPSPVKEKRARVGSQRALNLSSTLVDSDDDDTQHTVGAAEETFLEATPMKPPPGGRSFRVLFDEVLPTAQVASRQPTNRTLSRTMSAASKPNGFSNKRARSRAMSPSSSEDEGDDWENGTKLKSLMTSASTLHVVKSPFLQPKRPSNGPGKSVLPSAMLPGKDDLRSEKGPLKGPAPKGPLPRGKTPLGPVGASSAGRLIGKRARPDGRDVPTTMDITDGLRETKSIDHVPFLPPTPPRADTTHSRPGIANDKGKGKAAAVFSRKKARLLEQLGGDGISDDSADSEEDDSHVKLKEHSWNAVRRTSSALADELDDPEFEWPAHPAHPPDSPSVDSLVAKEGTVEVHLRDDLKRILSLSPHKRTEAEERKLADAVLYGRRESHYDAKGMEVWDVGEMSEGAEGMSGDGEDDWEGEPVPWEVGEL
ncbi:hypothetical protein EVJ58_g3612 [Rhodofomes roseus]|uniref:DNA replication regulator SLD2 n=1 Tax=Rhodofomes roseus TaxID=34475 RepID=A0A4Y9YLM1_9APHY|nr:hypothetical protein EVJ58_g3612 [Rhodofomes roseus]